MPEYIFTSKDMSGKIYKGTIEADNIENFYRILNERGQFCITAKENGTSSKNVELTPKKLKLKSLAIFARQFSIMLNSGLTVIKCLDVLYQQAQNKLLKSVILGVYEAVQKGDSLSKAMKAQDKAFPPLFLSMIESGEASGSLDSVMKRTADQFEKDNKMNNKVKQALVYPVFLIVMTLAVVIFMLTFILPRFMDMFKQYGGQVPLPTKILLAVSGALINYWYIILIVAAGICLLFYFWLKSPAGRLNWDTFKLKVPVFGKLQLIMVSSRFSRTLASLFSSGMPIVQALEIAGNVIENKFIEGKIRNVCDDMRRGISLSYAIRKLNLFPPMFCSMINIGEESGNLDSILEKTSAFYDEEADTAIQKMISLIEPIMIVILAFIIGFILISIFLPMYTIYNSIGSS